ncbi:hypothetical protein BKA83DRAFT_4128909 [Pisolithus microcarpus]|nr:hypothetical protein BKA83DRAFT_4128909 [Pisolithus microcarpus]
MTLLIQDIKPYTDESGTSTVDIPEDERGWAMPHPLYLSALYFQQEVTALRKALTVHDLPTDQFSHLVKVIMESACTSNVVIYGLKLIENILNSLNETSGLTIYIAQHHWTKIDVEGVDNPPGMRCAWGMILMVGTAKVDQSLTADLFPEYIVAHMMGQLSQSTGHMVVDNKLISGLQGELHFTKHNCELSAMCQLLGYSHMLLRQPGLEIPQEWMGQRGECPFPQGYPIVSINIGGVWGPSGTFSNLYRGLNCAILRLFWGILQGEWTNSKGDFGDSPG